MKTLVARDSKNQIMWVKGRTDLSPLTYREWREGHDMLSGTIRKIFYIEHNEYVRTEQVFYPPFSINEEEL